MASDVLIEEVRVVTDRVLAELEAALQAHHQFNGAHEAWAVIYEEVEELKSSVFWDRKTRTDAEWVRRMEHEAVQIAAMALRFLLEVPRCYQPGPEEKTAGAGDE